MPVAELTLPGEARSASAARRFLDSTLTGWGDTRYSEDAALLLSELVTNAALHARTNIVVQIELTAGSLRLAVTDGSPRQPVLRHYSDQSTTGRGLALVTALAADWGIKPNPDGSKTVWAELGPHGQGGKGSEEKTVVDMTAFPDLEDTAASGEADGPTARALAA